jgi:dGTPase
MKTEDLRKYRGALKHLAFDSQKSLGRRTQDDEDLILADISDPFWIDALKIVHSKGFRRESHKTQVWSSPDNPLIRNRMTHTLEVMAIAEAIAQILGLNVNLVKALALVHDIGHPPFGHAGERELGKILGFEFKHEIFSVILTDKIERQGKGLNLSFEVLDGAPYHSNGPGIIKLDPKCPPEYMVIRLADKLAYLSSDINDALRMGYIKSGEIPETVRCLGNNQREWINNCIAAVVKESALKGRLSFSNSVAAMAVNKARTWMFKHVYQRLADEIERKEYADDINRAHLFLASLLEGNTGEIDPVTVLATLTDQEVRFLAKARREGTVGSVMKLKSTGSYEIMPYCQRHGFAPQDIDLSWAQKKRTK